MTGREYFVFGRSQAHRQPTATPPHPVLGVTGYPPAATPPARRHRRLALRTGGSEGGESRNRSEMPARWSTHRAILPTRCPPACWQCRLHVSRGGVHSRWRGHQAAIQPSRTLQRPGTSQPTLGRWQCTPGLAGRHRAQQWRAGAAGSTRGWRCARLRARAGRPRKQVKKGARS